jgi:hypothetical protein
VKVARRRRVILLVIVEAVKQYSSSYHTTKIKRMYEHAEAAFVVISPNILNEVYVRTLSLFLILLLFLSLLLSFFPFYLLSSWY